MSGESQDAAGGGEGTVQCHELERLKREWLWFFALGIALVVLGTVAVGSAFFVSVLTVVMFGVLLLLGGVSLIVSAFWAGKWSGLLVQLLMGILYVVVGMLIIDAPAESTVRLTLMIAAILIVSGLFRIIAAMMLRFPNWGWPLLSGVVTLLLGMLIYRGWPATGTFAIGLFVGIEMIFYGWTWVMLGLSIRRLAKQGSA